MLINSDVGQITRVEWMIDVGVAVARRAWIKMSARAFELTMTIRLFVDMHCMEPGLQMLQIPRHLENDSHQPLLAKLEFNEIGMARDSSLASGERGRRAHHFSPW